MRATKNALEDLSAEATTQYGFHEQQHNKLEALEDKLHEIELKNIRDHEKASSNSSSRGPQPASPIAPAPAPSSPEPNKAAGISVTVNNPTFPSGNPKELRDFARSLKKELDAINRLS